MKKYSRYTRGDRLIHIQKRVPFRYLDAEKYNGKVYYVGIDDAGNKIMEEPQMVRLLQRDSIGNYYILNNKKKYLHKSTILYHGSTQKISKFTYHSTREGNDEDGCGIYLTNNLDEAKRYGKYIHVVVINKNAKELKQEDKPSLTLARKIILESKDVEYGLSNYAENKEVALQKFFEYNDTEHAKELFDSICHDFYLNKPNDFLKNMTAIGYDYMKVKKTDEVTHYIIIDPSIIKILRTIEV